MNLPARAVETEDLEPTCPPRLHAVPAGPSVPAPRHTAPASLRESVERLAERRTRAEADIDQRARDRHAASGKLEPRERLERLLDDGTFVELNQFSRHRASGLGMDRRRPDGDGVVTGWGTVDGRTVFVYAHDARVFGGALGEVFAEKIHAVMDLAESIGAPIIGLNDGGGARIQEGVAALAGFGGVFRRNVRASGVIPQISIVLGSCAGGAVYSPALTDFVFMVKDAASMYITGPDVIRAVTSENVTKEALGGAEVHGERTGVATFVCDGEQDAFDGVRYLLSFLPANNNEVPPEYDCTDDVERRCEQLVDLVPLHERTPYDMREVIEHIVDDGEYLEVHETWARNIVCVFARLAGKVVGIVGNQPMALAGVLDIDASEKAARFVRTCDAFNIPLVTLVDVPGFLPGTDQEHGGIIRRGRETALRLLRSERAAGAGHRAQGVRRCVHRDGLQVDRHRHLLRLAGQPDRRDGRGRCRGHHLPARDRCGRRSGDSGARSWSRNTRTSCSTRTRPPNAASSTTSSIRPTPAAYSSVRWRCWAPSATTARPASTGTSRCEHRPHHRRRERGGGGRGAVRAHAGASRHGGAATPRSAASSGTDVPQPAVLERRPHRPLRGDALP